MIPARLTRGMSPEAVKTFEESYKAAGFVLRQIAAILTEDYNQLVKKSEVDNSDFMRMTWTEMQALNVAERRAIQKMLRYLPNPDLIVEEKEDGGHEVK